MIVIAHFMDKSIIHIISAFLKQKNMKRERITVPKLKGMDEMEIKLKARGIL